MSNEEGVVSVDKSGEDGGTKAELEEDDFEESLFPLARPLPASRESSFTRFQAEAMASAPELLGPEDGPVKAGLLRRHSAGQPPLAPGTAGASGGAPSGKGGRGPMSSLTLAGLDLDEEALANAAPLHMHTMLIPSRLSLGSVGGGTPPTGRSRSSSRGASRSVSPARAGTPTGVASATATTVSTVTSHPASPFTAPPAVVSAGGATLTASNLAKLAATAETSGAMAGQPTGVYSAPASVAGDVTSSSVMGGGGGGIPSSAASSVAGDFGVPSSSASAPAFGNSSASNLNLWEVSSTNATIDPDIFLDTKGLDDLEPPGEITIGGGSFSSLHGSFSASVSALPSVVERASEETLEDFRAFCDVVPSSHTTTSASSVSGSSVAGGSVAGDASCILETLEEEDDDLLDDEDEDEDGKLRPIHQTLVEEKDEDFDDDLEDDLHRKKPQHEEDEDVAAVIKGVITSMLVEDPKSEEASIPTDLIDQVAGSVVRQGSLSKATPKKEELKGEKTP